jgi:hypothetical protein
VIARLLAFMLFTLFWGPGNFYPLMIFVLIHMILAAIIHIVFSEDLAYFKKGYYLKFWHNVMMNSFASIYFHNYLRFDEMPESADEVVKTSVEDGVGEDIEFIDSQRPGLHISTFLRQLTFDTLYALEFVILLGFGFSSDVEDIMLRKPILITVILSLSLLSVFLRIFNYIVMHVWRNVILTGKKLIRQEIKEDTEQDQNNAGIQHRFFKYVFISRNTWILGELKHIETTLIVLPKRIIEAIKGRGQDLEYNFNDATKHSPLEFLATQKLNNLIISLLCFPLVLLVIVLNVLVIVMLLIGLVMTIPVAVCVFLYNLKSGFRAVDLQSNDDAIDGFNTLELPPEIESGEAAIFQCDPTRTLAKFQQNLLEDGGRIDLTRFVDVTADEFQIFAMNLLSLNRKRHPMKLLILDNCDLTDDKLEQLTPLLVKFERVTMNGSQKMTAAGWDCLGQAIKIVGNKLRKIEIKIAKNANDDDVIRLRREILLEELKGPTMTAESLRKIASFMPLLEKLCLDDVFSDNMFAEMLTKSRSSDNLIDAWKDVAKKITQCPISERKLRCLSLPGCAINDEILTSLSPALVRIRAVHLGRNPITASGWEAFKNALEDESKAICGSATLTLLSLSTLNNDGSNIGGIGSSRYVHAPAMKQLAHIILKLEEVNLSGQHEIGADGWSVLANIVRLEVENGTVSRLKVLKLVNCKIKKETREMLEDVFAKSLHPCPKLDFGGHDMTDSGQKSCFCCCCS